ncbi:hypothetical protein RFI_27877 [Reticulomyxa filosa]|uniref:Uncharacterized protein n=1 Tax=Reticulomyxa filosa TaxID=46433 RepID=X6M790_RETFI|nr:hypothetical protein RFI_27877 [Reticulomyxa filosa]|eukprot:ETO09501.1 hypothetical protein RFI_27877 [Reticulomyxa filosa]
MRNDDNGSWIVDSICETLVFDMLRHQTKLQYKLNVHELQQTIRKAIRKRYSQTEASVVDKILHELDEAMNILEFSKSPDGYWNSTRDNFSSKQLWIGLRKLFSIFYFIMIKIKIKKKNSYCFPEKMQVKNENGKWKTYRAAFNWKRRRLLLFNAAANEQEKIVFISKKCTEIDLKFSTDFSELETSHKKWHIVTLSPSFHVRLDSWMVSHFRFSSWLEFQIFSLTCATQKGGVQQEKESVALKNLNLLRLSCFQVQIKFLNFLEKQLHPMFRIAVNPYTATFDDTQKKIEEYLRIMFHSFAGIDQVLYCYHHAKRCEPPIPESVRGDTILNDVYQSDPNYPNICVTWDVSCFFMAPYERTVEAKVKHKKPMNIDHYLLQSEEKKIDFNPFLYINEVAVIRMIDAETFLLSNKLFEAMLKEQDTKMLKALFHEVIANGYGMDLVDDKKSKSINIKVLKQNIKYDENNKDQLILDENILHILKIAKDLFHSDIHKSMGYPLHLFHICALYLYCGKDCNVQFGKDLIKFEHAKWMHLDWCLQCAIQILSLHERREKNQHVLYRGLCGVRLKDVSQIREGLFHSYVSTSYDLNIAKIFQSSEGCILEFHPSMRRAPYIFSCDVSWISPHKDEAEILFARSIVFINEIRENPRRRAWNAYVKHMNDRTQVIALRWSEFDLQLEPTITLTNLCNVVDHNVIYCALRFCDHNVAETADLLYEFVEWKDVQKHEQSFQKQIDQFQKNRCWNNEVNKFCFFLTDSRYTKQCPVQYAQKLSIFVGLPFIGNEDLSNL